MKNVLFLLMLLGIFLSGCSIPKTGKVLTYIPDSTEIIERDDCFGEGETVPLKIAGSNECCPGLKLIDPPSDNYVLVKGICTNCGNKHCSKGETKYNCPEDCNS